MNDNIVTFTGITKADMDPKRVLEAALEAGLTHVVVLGWIEGKDQSEMYMALSNADAPFNVWLMDRAKLQILQDNGE